MAGDRLCNVAVCWSFSERKLLVVRILSHQLPVDFNQNSNNTHASENIFYQWFFLSQRLSYSVHITVMLRLHRCCPGFLELGSAASCKAYRLPVSISWIDWQSLLPKCDNNGHYLDCFDPLFAVWHCNCLFVFSIYYMVYLSFAV